MADELVQEAANEAREVFGRRLICLHDQGETDAVVTMRIIKPSPVEKVSRVPWRDSSP